MLIAGVDDTAYEVVKTLHILLAIVGFGTVMLAGIYGKAAGTRLGPVGRGIAETNAKANKVAEYCIYLVPLLGFALIGMSDKAYTFKQTWVTVSIGLYVLALVGSLVVLQPAEKRFVALSCDPANQAECDALGKRLAAVGGILNLIMIVILFLMVAKPGLAG